jgi:peroxiredoxin (alkyl hydroperoxide reductase subunit C)
MALVGKKFPNLTVDAISFMGDNLRINVLEEATKNNKKVLLFWYPKDFTLYALQNYTLFKLLYKNLKKETQW